MKKLIVFFMAICLLLAGCANSQEPTTHETIPAETVIPETVASEETAAVEEVADAQTIQPLPDTTLDNLTDAILSVALEVGDVYVDEAGVTKMDLEIYSYDLYDMVDIANLKVGDTLVTCYGHMVVTSKEETETGTILINGGLDEGGIDLATDGYGVYYEQGYSDVKNWYVLGEETFVVSENFKGCDGADLDYPDAELSADLLLDGQINVFDFTPYNTTVRVEGGKIVELTRVYTP